MTRHYNVLKKCANILVLLNVTVNEEPKNFLLTFLLFSQFSHIAIWGSIGLWVVFFIIYSSLWPLIPLAPDMSGEVSARTLECTHTHIYTRSHWMFPPVPTETADVYH